jgi:excisionase family DNA binding protein
MRHDQVGPPLYDDLPELCTPDEVAQFLRMTRNHVYGLVSSGVLPALRFGKLIRIPKTALLTTEKMSVAKRSA